MLRVPFCWQFYQIEKEEKPYFVALCGVFDRLKIEVVFIIGGKWVVQAEATD